MKEEQKNHADLGPGTTQTMFTVTKSVHGMPCVEGRNLTPEQCQTVRSVVTDNWTGSPSYKLRTACSAFLQGYQEDDGWVLVEFWSREPAAIDAFVKHLNEVLADAPLPLPLPGDDK